MQNLLFLHEELCFTGDLKGLGWPGDLGNFLRPKVCHVGAEQGPASFVVFNQMEDVLVCLFSNSMMMLFSSLRIQTSNIFKHLQTCATCKYKSRAYFRMKCRYHWICPLFRHPRNSRQGIGEGLIFSFNI